ncbi:MAG TPA: hypothetical protein VM492_09500 [Sumerlaeia bacterium]|nr:hypothetical protein [Sumerlaeia bacterium]
MRQPVLVTGRGVSCRDSWLNYSKGIARALREWDSRIHWAPKDLRNCLPTFAAMRGVLNDVGLGAAIGVGLGVAVSLLPDRSSKNEESGER